MEDKNKELIDQLWREAREVRNRAHAPYSGFLVGAAILTQENKIYSGCNVENASYGGTVCAERVAILKAVSEGHKKFQKIFLVTDAKGIAVPPCGMCLQVMSEFCDSSMPVILATPKEIQKELQLGDLLPSMFKKEYL